MFTNPLSPALSRIRERGLAWHAGCASLLAALFFCSTLAQALPQIEHWQTSNGARVLFVAAPALPMVDVRVAFAGGSARDGDKPGTALLANALLDDGAAGLSADAIATRMDDLGAQYEYGVDRDIAWASLRVLTDEKTRSAATRLFADLLRAPDYRAADFERERARALSALAERLQSPDEVAEEAFYRTVYGAHPYAQPPAGTEAGLTSLSRDDLSRFHHSYYTGANAVVAIVGALSRAEAGRLADTVIGQLPAGSKAAAIATVSHNAEAREQRIEHPATQTHLFLGQPGMSRTDPDYFALYVANHVLGGSGIVSRLYDEVREKRGLSYSVYSYFLPLAQPGPFLVGAQTRNDQADATLALLRETVERYLKEGPSEKELAAAKQNITGGFALRVDSNKKIAEYLAVIGFYDLPLDYLERFNERIETVTREAAHDAIRKRLDPARFAAITVGGKVQPK
jgi:zinc protease